MTTLVQQALAVAQELDVAVFPVGADKRPVLKGWQTKASRDPAEIRRMFTMNAAAGIGVPCGSENDLICFDLDFGHTEDPERKAALQAWLDRWMAVIEGGAVVRRTRSGGLHVIMSWPSKARPPRRIMPKLDVIIEGFYFVWAMEDGSYTPVVAADIILEPPPEMLEVVERDTLGSGSALMSPDEAHEAMWSNGDAGMRHDALLKMTHDWVQERPGLGLAKLCEGFEAWFRDIYGERIEAARLDQLLQWWIEDGGDAGGELGRAMAGALRKAPPDDDLLQRMLAKAQAKGESRLTSGPLNVAKQYHEPPKVTAERMAGEFTDLDLNEVLAEEIPDVDWIVDDLIPAGNLVSVSGPSGAGKTRFNAMLMAALSTGETDKVGLPKASRPVRSLYIANEERTEDVKRRLKAAAKLNDLTGNMLITVRGKEHGRFHLIGGDGAVIQPVVDKLIEVIREREIEVVMIDPIVTIGIEEENAAAQVDAAMGALQNIASATGACVLFVHHSPKGERTAPEDALRGDSGAWRGSGVFYSSLDIGMTLMPWLPDECHEKGNGAANRRRWRAMVRNHQAPKYVVLDSAKERENEGLGSVLYEIVGQEVRVGGRKIGAMRPVSEAEARLRATHLLSAVDVDEVVAHEVARTLLAEWPRSRPVTLTEAVEILNEKQPAGWQLAPEDEKIRADRGTGKLLLDLLAGPIAVGKRHVSLSFNDRKAVWQVT